LAFSLIWHEKVLKDFESINVEDAGRIEERIKKYLALNPEILGKPLKGMFKGFYSYRIGDYRVIYTLDRAENTIRILHMKHRKEAYRR
jgi:mRNA interferase RelE/StbE